MLSVRVSQETLAWIDEQVRKSKGRFEGEHDRTSFVNALIAEGKAKRERCRKWRQIKKARQQQREGRA